MRNIIFLLLFFVAGCAGDYKNNMNNGYIFVRTNADNHSIIDKNQSTIITTNIIRYVFNEEWVIGFRENSRHPDDPSSQQPEGYFALKTSNGDLLLGINKSKIKAFIRDKELNKQKFQRCIIKKCHTIDSVSEIVP